MQLRWVKDLKSPEDIDKFKKSLKNAKLVLDKLAQICYNTNIELDKVSLDDFDNPNWALKRAFEEGKKAAYRDIIDLTKVD